MSPRDLFWGAWRIGRKTAFSLPSIKLHIDIAHLRGRTHTLIRGTPKHVRSNLQTAFGAEFDSKQIERIARDYSAFTKRLYLERVIPMLPRFSAAFPGRITGLHHLDEALAAKRGAMIVTAHFGYSRLIVPLLKAKGYEVKQVVAGGESRIARKAMEDETLAEASAFRRSVHDRTRVLADRIGEDEIVAGLDIRPILQALASNQVVLIAGDGMRAAELVALPLLNTVFPFPVGYIKIALGVGAPLMPAFATEKGRKIVLEIHPPLPLDPGSSTKENAGLVAAVLTEQLRKSPHLWARWGIKNLFEKAMQWSETDLRERHRASRSL